MGNVIMNKEMKAQKQRLADYIQQQLMRNAYEIGRQHGKAEAEAQQNKLQAPIVTPAPYWRRPK